MSIACVQTIGDTRRVDSISGSVGHPVMRTQQQQYNGIASNAIPLYFRVRSRRLLFIRGTPAPPGEPTLLQRDVVSTALALIFRKYHNIDHPRN